MRISNSRSSARSRSWQTMHGKQRIRSRSAMAGQLEAAHVIAASPEKVGHCALLVAWARKVIEEERGEPPEPPLGAIAVESHGTRERQLVFQFDAKRGILPKSMMTGRLELGGFMVHPERRRP